MQTSKSALFIKKLTETLYQLHSQPLVLSVEVTATPRYPQCSRVMLLMDFVILQELPDSAVSEKQGFFFFRPR